MKKSQWLVVSAFMVGMAAPASAATTDPEVIIYRFPGVRDAGSPSGQGVATIFSCTNFSGNAENIMFVVRDGISTLVANAAVSMPHLTTIVAATHPSNLYATSLNLQTGGIQGIGTAAIAATSASIVCTAMVLDAFSSVPQGISLHGIRFNPAPGSQE
jgi:hypothetical protein